MSSSANYPDNCDVLIITALSEEFETFRDLFDFHSPHQLALSPISYHTAELSAKTGQRYRLAALSLDGMGNTRAGIIATIAIQHLRPYYVIMLGFAGGFEGAIRIGDVAIPRNIYYLGLGKHRETQLGLNDRLFFALNGEQPPDGREVRPEPLETDPTVLRHIHDFLKTQEFEDFEVKPGPYAVTEEVIDNEQRVRDILRIHPKMIGLDMESYGVGRAAQLTGLGTKFFAVRGISDLAKDKDDGARPRALANTTEFLLKFLRSGTLPLNLPLPTDPPAPKLLTIQHLSLFESGAISHAIPTDLPDLRHYDVDELVISQLDLLDDHVLAGKQEALSRQKQALDDIDTFRDAYPGSDMAYFGLAHIPFTFHLGYHLSLRKIAVYGHRYDDKRWFALADDDMAREVLIEQPTQQSTDEYGEVVIRISTTLPVTDDAIADFLSESMASFNIHLRVYTSDPTGPINNQATLNACADAFANILRRIRTDFPNTQHIHIFAACQPTLAFRCGQRISKSMDPPITVYNYSRHQHPHYKWGMNIQQDTFVER